MNRSGSPTVPLLTAAAALVLLLAFTSVRTAAQPAGERSATGSPFAPAEPVSVSAAWSLAAAAPGDQLALAVVLDIAHPYHANPEAAQIPAELDFLIPTTLEVTTVPDALRVGSVQYPRAQTVEVNYTGKLEKIPAYAGRTVLYVPVIVSDDADPGATLRLALSLTYQSCDDKQCLPPVVRELEATLAIVAPEARDAGGVDAELFAGFDRSVFADLASGRVAELVVLDLFGWALPVDAATGVGYAMLLALAGLGGLLLNFTPCVLPVIPIKIMGLSAAAGDRARCFLLGLSMSLGVIAFWLALGGAIAATVAAAAKGFEGGITATNELFQYPLFTIVVGVVIAVMAIGMCGLFAIPLPRFIYAIQPRHDTYVGSFGFGIMTAILSTPCTAPFMGAAAAWAVTKKPSTTLGVFAVIGLGMALPYLLLSAFPQLAARMPRTGPASELLKQVMGLLMLAAAAYFIGVGITGLTLEAPDPPSLVYWWAVVACVVAAALWLAWRTFAITRSTTRRAVFSTLAALLAAAAIAAGVQLSDRGPIRWTYYTPERFAAALDAGNTVVVDFTAEWCLNCKAIEQAVLYDKRVVQALHGRSVVPMKVDLTGRNPDGNAMLRRAGRVAIPLLVVYDAGGDEVFKSDSYTVQQVLDAVAAAQFDRPSTSP